MCIALCHSVAIYVRLYGSGVFNFGSSFVHPNLVHILLGLASSFIFAFIILLYTHSTISSYTIISFNNVSISVMFATLWLSL